MGGREGREVRTGKNKKKKKRKALILSYNNLSKNWGRVYSEKKNV